MYLIHVTLKSPLLHFLGIMDLRMYPYGNAHEKKLPNGHYAYECQHGGRECQGNFIEACIQRATNFKASLYYPVLECMEAAKDPLNAAQECLENFVPNAKWDDISKCVNVMPRPSAKTKYFLSKTKFFCTDNFFLCRQKFFLYRQIF